jgi:Lrp/AsnC family leucine-responsive transcriptional regulator
MKFGNESPLDELDWKIIVALQEDARLSMAALGRKIGLSPPATTERVRRLEERKIIRAYRAEIGLDRLGLPVEVIVRIKAPGHGLDKATRALCAFPEVLECHRATGGDCFVLRVAVSDIKELQRLLDRIAPFGDLTTSVILSTPLRQKTVRNRSALVQPATRHGRSVGL